MEGKEVKMRSLKFLGLGFLIILLIGLSFNCKWLKNPFGTDIDNGDNGEDPGECERPLEPPVGNIGDTIQSCHFEIEFKWAERTDEYKGARPRDRENNTLIVFYVRVKLIKFNEETAYVFSDNFTLEDNQGNKYSWNGDSPEDWLTSAELREDQEIEGTVTIEAPKTSSGFTTMFSCPYTDIYPDKIKCDLGL